MHVYNSQISTSIICFKYLKIVTVNPVRTNKESISFFNYALTRKLPLRYAHINKQRWDRYFVENWPILLHFFCYVYLE